MLDVLITGAAAGIIGVLSGQGMQAWLKKRNEPWHVGVPLTEAEVREIVIKDPGYIDRKGVMELVKTLAEDTQNAITTQSLGLQELIERSRLSNIQNQEQAARIAQARAQVMNASAPAPSAPNPEMQQIQAQVEAMQRQVFGGQ